MTEMNRREVAIRALRSLDLTNLDADCTEQDVAALAGRAFTPYGPVAAICVWPRFVKHARKVLGGRRIPVCTVVNFPKGGIQSAPVLEETKQALRDGADEIDMVAPYQCVMTGQPEVMRSLVERVRGACGPARLKVIIETCVLTDPALIQQAAEIAIAGGADFVKTGTGKVPGRTSVMDTRAILRAIRAAKRPVGLKVSGGVRTIEDAARHLSAVRDVMGPDWATPQTFRIGASGLLDALLTELKGR